MAKSEAEAAEAAKKPNEVINAERLADAVLCMGTQIELGWAESGHNGCGVYCWNPEYPDGGSIFICADMNTLAQVAGLLATRLSENINEEGKK